MITRKQIASFAARVQRRVERTVFPLGSTVECPYCGWTGWRFLSAGLYRTPNRLCPRCSSLERYRMLPLVLSRELNGRRDIRILELAPKPCFSEWCRNQSGWRYTSSDLASPLAMVLGDLRRMPFATGVFDAIVCFHVMEHIHEDGPSFAEIGRLLAPDGLAVICVPLRSGPTLEGAPPKDWERLYGQEDHVRYYGDDIVDRMQSAGLVVTRVDTHAYFSARELERYALRGDDRYLFFVRRRPA